MSFDLQEAVREALASDEPEALAFAGRWRSWRWLATFAQILDARLAEAGMERAPLSLVARNRPQHIAALTAQLAAGRATSMIYSAQTPAGLAADIARLRPAVILADAEDWSPEVIAVAAAMGSLGLMLRDSADAADAVMPVPGLTSSSGDYRALAPDAAFELLSSGTTGPPKRVVMRWPVIRNMVMDAKSAYPGTGMRDAPLLMSHPLGNVAGVAYIAPAIAHAQRIALLERFDAHGWAEAVRTYKPVRTSLPPAGVRMVLDAEVPKQDLASLTLVVVGGGKLDSDLQERFETRYGLPVFTAFGATEFGGVIANWTADAWREHGASKRGSAGRLMAGVKARIVDPESGAELPFGQAGLLEARVPRIGPDWIRTTDLASLDADGFLYIHGRADAAINRGGFKIVPDKLAEILKEHWSVADAAVVGKPDQRLGEVPVAAVELVAGQPPIDGEALRTWSRDRLLAYEVPVEIRVVPTLPRNSSMKISIAEVKALFERK